MTEIEYVGRPLNNVVQELNNQGLRYNLVRTNAPNNSKFPTDDQNLYIIRQQRHDDDILHLTVAAKMGKEVS